MKCDSFSAGKVRCLRIFVSFVLVLFASMATGQMVSVDADGKRVVYSKYYDLGVWLDEGKLGLQITVDHGPLPNPNVVVATGSVTIYLVNLENIPRQIQGLSVVTARKHRSLPQDATAMATQRARTRVSLGTIPIYDYGTEIPLSISIGVDGLQPRTMTVVVPRLTERQLEAFGPKGRPPYPWFKAPYFPFEPPLAIID